MTSSLVGSEMCIRDSLWPSVHGPPCCEGDGGCEGGPPAEVVERKPIVPVSYTHLTLPTICSV
eukprot:6880993-Prorocentrum_lima.AAC.1